MKILQKLISIPSYSSQEQKIQTFIKECFESWGIKPFFQDSNLIVYLKGEDQTRAFIFNGHTDVVDTGDIKKWKYNPWSGHINNNKIYGRGASDMKGGVWAMMQTAKSLAGKSKIPTDVWFTFVAEEETNGNGTKQFVNWFKAKGYLKHYREVTALITEPTNLDTVKYGHRGNFFIMAKTRGVVGHSARSTDTTSQAILKMNIFICDLIKENLKWQKQFKGSEFTPPSITPTSIEATSESPNKTADSCRANFDLRTVPGYHQKAFNKIKQLADKRGVRLSLIHPSTPAGYTKPDAKIIKAFQRIIPGIKTAVNDASNDLGFFLELGVDGVMFGPGEVSQAHKTNEFTDIDKVMAAPKIFTRIYTDWAKQI